MNMRGSIWIIVALVVLSLGVECGYIFGTRDTVEFKVNKTEIKRYKSGDDAEDKYLVFTNKGVFENTDSLFVGKCNSSDLHGKIEVGKCYRAKVYGFRIHCNSTYKNIVDVQQIECPK